MKKLQRLELLKDFVQEAIDRGATSVESIHQYIADLPFEALEVTGLLDRDKSRLRARHQRTIGMVYGAIRRINGEIGQLISDQFENLEESVKVDTLLKPAPEPTPAAAPKPAVTKGIAKKTPLAGKPVVNKAAVKTSVSKKTAVKKVLAKKAVAKKTVGKKTVAKKTVAKKTVAKKTAPRKK
jgi:hypothetical protein